MNRIFIMRHGQAEPMKADDVSRQLTLLGKKEADDMAVKLSLWIPQLDALLVSPYLRAQQTAAQIKRRHPKIEFEQTCADFTPDASPQTAADYLLALMALNPNLDTWLIVSHMPMVSYLVDQLCPGKMPIFNTAAIAEIEFDLATQAGRLVAISSPQVCTL